MHRDDVGIMDMIVCFDREELDILAQLSGEAERDIREAQVAKIKCISLERGWNMIWMPLHMRGRIFDTGLQSI